MNEAQRKTKELMPFILKEINQYIKPNTTTSTGTGTTTSGGASASALAALSAAFNAHQGLDPMAAHVSNDPTVNVRREYWADNFGFAFDGTTDDGNALQRMLDTIGAAGGGIVHVASQTSTGSLYYNKTISCYYDNMDVRFHNTPMISGATGCIRIMGSQDEYTRRLDLAAMKLRSSSTVNGSNQTVLPLSTSDSTLLEAGTIIVQAGDKIVVRGQNDISGKAIQKDSTFVSSVVRISATQYNIVCVDELDYTFSATYPSSEWPPDLTTGTTIYIVRYGSFTADLPAGSWFVQVNDITGFSVGDVIQVGDNRTENAFNAAAIKSDGTPYANPAALEIVRIRGFNLTGGDSNVVYFDRATVVTYLSGSTYHGGIARYVPVRNSHLSGANITYNAHQTSTGYNSLQQTYAVDCSIHDCFVDGIGGRAAHAIRTSYALNCVVYNNNIRDCYDSSSGRGYGITLYYCTGCYGWDNIVAGCRHNYLHQLAIQCGLWGCESRNHLGTGFDFHGVNSRFCFVHNCTCTSVNNNTSDLSINNAYAIQVGNTSHVCGDHNITISDCRVYFNHGSSDGALAFVPASSDVIFTNCVVYNANIGIRMILNSSQITPVQTATNIKILDCHFINCSLSTDTDHKPWQIVGVPTYTGAVSTGKLDKLTIRNCIDDGNTKHLEIVGASGITNVYIDNYLVVNNVSTAGNFGILISNVAGATVRSCDLTGSNKGISLTNVTGPARIIDNALFGLIDGVAYAYVDGGGNTGAVFLLKKTDTGVGIGTGNPGHLLDVQDLSGANVAFIQTLNALTAVNSHAALALVNQSTAVNSIVGLDFLHYNASGTNKVIATQEAAPSTNTAGAEVGFLRWALINAGTVAEVARLTPTGLGLGVTAPARRLDVSDLSGANSAIIRGSASGTAVNSQAVLSLENQNNSNNTITGLALMHYNSASATKTAATIEAALSDTTASAEYGFLRFSTINNGTVTERLRITDNGFVAVSGVLTVGTNALISGYIYGPGGTNTLSTYQDLSVGGGSGSGNLTVNGTINGGNAVKHTRVVGSLSASQTMTANIDVSGNAASLITDGTQIVSVSYSPSAASKVISVRAYIPYLSSNANTIFSCTLWAGSTCIAQMAQQIGSGATSGDSTMLAGQFTSVSTSALTIQLRIGPNVNTTTLTLNPKFGNASNTLCQPIVDIDEHV